MAIVILIVVLLISLNWVGDSPEIDVLINRGDAQVEVDGHKHEADNRIRTHHAVYNLPHGRAAVIKFTGIPCN